MDRAWTRPASGASSTELNSDIYKSARFSGTFGADESTNFREGYGDSSKISQEYANAPNVTVRFF